MFEFARSFFNLLRELPRATATTICFILLSVVFCGIAFLSLYGSIAPFTESGWDAASQQQISNSINLIATGAMFGMGTILSLGLALRRNDLDWKWVCSKSTCELVTIGLSVYTAFLIVTGVVPYLIATWTQSTCKSSEVSTLLSSIEHDNETCVSYHLDRTTMQNHLPSELVLHKAIKNGNPAIISKILAHYPTSIHLADQEGITPLHIAVESARLDIVCTLLAHGAHTQVISRDHVSAEDLAQELNLNDIIDVLQRGEC